MMHLVSINSALSNVITAFSWMLIHSLWQGLFLAIVAGVVLLLAKKSSAVYRYNLMLLLFLLFILGSGLTFIYELQSTSASTVNATAPGADAKSQSLFFDVHTAKQFINSFTSYFSANAPLIMMCWFMIFLVKSIRMISSLAYNQRIRNHQVYEPGRFWIDRVTEFSGKLGITKTVKLLQSGYVKVPVVVGHLKPVILMPVGLMSGLPVAQVEAILLHELAHIRRNDYFINFLQHVAEAIFFFNPGLLWVSTVLKEERENCCDDVALQQTNDKIGFVQALISFKEHQLYGGGYATAFPGKKNYLMRRVTRILSNDNRLFGRSEKVFFIISALLFGMVVTTAAVARIKEYSVVSVKKEAATVKTTKPSAILMVSKAKAGKKPHKLIARPKALSNITADKLKERQDVVNLQLSRRQLANALTNVAKLQDNDLSAEAEQQRKQLDAAVLQAERNKMQADLDRKQSVRDRAQAEKDRQQAELDRQQAEQDRIQAEKDRRQAELDRVQADKDRQQAEKDRAQAEIERLHRSAKSLAGAQE
ncbi:MAG: M56 family metallopeptidase [Mucilaginibacter sp.]